jgi:glycosyltransferase involved in cell wall biosynthesis
MNLPIGASNLTREFIGRCVLPHHKYFIVGVPSRPMEEKVPISILYLGRRGGGAKITKVISEELLTSNSFSLAGIYIRKDNEIREEYERSQTIDLFNGLVTLETVLKIIQYLLVPKKLLADMRLSSSSFCLVPMVSPLGLIIESLLKIQGVKVIRLLHDFEKHPGDNWPPSFLIRYLIKDSNFLIALSSDVANKIKRINPKIDVSVYPHPVFDFSTFQDGGLISDRYMLFVGRIREYKGIMNLLSAFDNLEIKDMKLVIAGEGELQVKVDERIVVINRWLLENEIGSLVTNAEAIVFPYIEASQSGILPFCVSENKKVVLTPLPGLLEQTAGYENAFIAKDLSADSLRVALQAAIKSETLLTNSKNPITKKIELCLLESGFFTKE